MIKEFNFHKLFRWKSSVNFCFADMYWKVLVEQLALISFVFSYSCFFVCVIADFANDLGLLSQLPNDGQKIGRNM